MHTGLMRERVETYIHYSYNSYLYFSVEIIFHFRNKIIMIQMMALSVFIKRDRQGGA